MHLQNFDDYFPEIYLKKHEENNWNYWRRGYELDRYEIYRLGRNDYKMIIPLKHTSFKVYYSTKDRLLSHLEYIKKDM